MSAPTYAPAHAADAALIRDDVEAYLHAHERKELLRFVVVGSVDDGKSTLIGRLLFETGGLYDDQVAHVRKVTKQGGEIDFSLFTDGLKAEREQGITIDVAYRYFTTPRRKFVIADTPGHVQYTRNMVTGASAADAAVILVDARLGLLPQSRRHAYLASMLGLRHLLVAVNKMDLVGWDRATFERITADLASFAAPLGFESLRFVPVSAPHGDNVARRSDAAAWYDGPTLLDWLESVPVGDAPGRLPFRFPVQLTLRPDLDYRGFAGRIASGAVAVGDEIVVQPSGRRSRVAGIDTFEGPIPHAHAPMSVTLRLADEVDVARGDVLAAPEAAPRLADVLDATVVWLHDTALDPSRDYLLKMGTRTVSARVERIDARLDTDTLTDVPATAIGLNDVARLRLRTKRALPVDAYADDRHTGRFILIDALADHTVGAGIVRGFAENSLVSETPSAPLVTPATRAARLGQHGAVVATSLAGAAQVLEAALFDRGLVAAVTTSVVAAEALARAGLVAVWVNGEASLSDLRASLGADGVLVTNWQPADEPAPALADSLASRLKVST